jgi:hypothetical protein
MPWPARRSHPDGICHPSLRQCGRKRGPLRPAPPPCSFISPNPPRHPTTAWHRASRPPGSSASGVVIALCRAATHLRPPTPAILARLASIPIPVKRFTDPEFSLLQCQVNAWNGEPKGASSPDAHGSATSTVLPDTGLLLLPLQSSLRVVGSGEDPMPTT